VFKDEDSKEKAARRQKRHGGAYVQQPVVQQPTAAGLENGNGYKPQPGTVVATAQPVTYERAPAV
jgi:hypothetical protein